MDGYLRMQILTFILTFLSNLSRHAMIESWFMMTPQLQSDLFFSDFTMGALNMLFLFSYAAGNVILGLLGDHYGAKKVLCFGMLISCFAQTLVISNQIVLFAVFSVRASAIYCFLIILSGFFQGSVWVCCVSIMGNWFSVQNRGKVLGLWIINTSIGGVLGSQITAGMVSSGVQWQNALIFFLYLYAASLFLNINLLSEKPEGSELSHDLDKKISIVHAFKLPGVAIYSVVFGCVKLLHYSYLMWLPDYVYEKLGQPEYAGSVLVSLYDVGGLVGAIVIGWVSDKLANRVFVFFPILIGCMPVIFSFSLGNGSTIWMFYLLIPFVGLILGGVSNLISSAVAADLGQIKDSEFDVKTTVVGIIDGSGGIGAGIGQIVIGMLKNKSWNDVFYFCFAINALAVAVITPLVVMALKKKNREDEEVKGSESE
jgi:sugar phosphate permease